MATIYAKSDATGANDGTSWTDAYTDLQAALNAVANGDTLYTDAPESYPWIGGYILSTHSNVTIITNAGPSGETWLTNLRKSTSWTESSGVWSISLASEPSHVAYDFKRDDISGTVTGCDLTTKNNARAIALHRSKRLLNLNDCRAWYGFLRDGGATTTPAEGEYGYTGGTLYINPPGTPDAATVNELAGYAGSATDALDLFQCSDCTVRGRLITKFYPTIGSNQGYGLVGTISTRNTFQGHIGIACGWHSCGHNNASGSDNRMTDCLALGTTGDQGYDNPYVFYSDGTSSGHIGTGLVHVSIGLLDVDGQPIEPNFVTNSFYSHTSGGANTLTAEWIDCLSIDFQKLIEDKHSITLGAGATWGEVVNGRNVPSIADHTDPDDYPLRAIRLIAVGHSASFEGGIYYEDPIIDREGQIDRTLSNGPNMMEGEEFYVKRGLFITGDATTGIISVAASSKVVFDAVTTVSTNANPSNTTVGIFNIETIVSDALILKNGCRFIAGDSLANHTILRSNTTTIWSDNLSAVTSDGTNLFEDGEWDTDTIRHNNAGVSPRNSSWWKANIVGGSTDDFDWATGDKDALVDAFFSVGGGGLLRRGNLSGIIGTPLAGKF